MSRKSEKEEKKKRLDKAQLAARECYIHYVFFLVNVCKSPSGEVSLRIEQEWLSQPIFRNRSLMLAAPHKGT
jgi:hypothetical protein